MGYLLPLVQRQRPDCAGAPPVWPARQPDCGLRCGPRGTAGSMRPRKCAYNARCSACLKTDSSSAPDREAAPRPQGQSPRPRQRVQTRVLHRARLCQHRTGKTPRAAQRVSGQQSRVLADADAVQLPRCTGRPARQSQTRAGKAPAACAHQHGGSASGGLSPSG